MIKTVVILDANNVISNGGPEVLKRHIDYARELEKLSAGNAKLVIIGNNTLIKNYSQISESDNSCLVVISIGEKRFTKLFFWKYAFTSLKENKLGVSLLVSGDPWISGLNSVILKCILLRRKKTLLQIQLHADVFAKGWKWLSFRNFIKFQIARIVIRRAELIRTVSKNQTVNLEKHLRKNQKISCIPVSLSIQPHNLIRTIRNFSTFGFLGRLHKDRGTELLISIFEKVLVQDTRIKLVIAGTGPEQMHLENTLLNKFPNQVQMLGQISGDQLLNFWQEIDVLVSLAEYESYGRAPRESIAMRVPVIALKSSGILDLMESELANWVSIIDREKYPQKFS
jgi:glycosyltransferase involved in cell wall biosynthesis